MRPPGSFSFVPLLLFLAAGCQPAANPSTAAPEPADSGPTWFAEVGAERGLTFVHDCTAPQDYFMPRTVGSGAALFDFDNDGRLDILLLQNAGPKSTFTHRLYHQEKDGRFTDVSSGSGLDVPGHGMGVAIGDINNDGWPDVLITEYGRLRLFLNTGKRHFTEITHEAGLESSLWGTSATFLDYDRDGLLDLVVACYVDFSPSNYCSDYNGTPEFCGPSSFPGTMTRLYHNRGPARGSGGRPRFDDVSVSSGLGRSPGPGLGAFAADFNGDRWPDILITNDGKPNHLWINQHDGTFKEEAVERGIAFNRMGLAEANMGIGLGDVDGDGLFDIFVTHLTDETNTLWKQGPRGLFQDHTPASGVLASRYRGTGFGTVLADFDHDGAVDLAVVNGRVRRAKGGEQVPEGALALGPFWSRYGERNQLFAGDGKGAFRDLSFSSQPFCQSYQVGRGLACGDIDGDGALDLLVTAVAGPARLYRNVAPNRGHWLLVRALDPRFQRDAHGAEITVRAGSKRWTRWLNPAYSYLCSNDPRAHFGLGAADRVDELVVVWPDGLEERFAGQHADRVLTLRRGSGSKVK